MFLEGALSGSARYARLTSLYEQVSDTMGPVPFSTLFLILSITSMRWAGGNVAQRKCSGRSDGTAGNRVVAQNV